MNSFKNVLHKWFKNEKKVLGRWNIDYCETKINYKIDLSNEDHCGPCGQYILNQTKIIQQHINIQQPINITNDKHTKDIDKKL